MGNLLESYKLKKDEIKNKLNEFKSVNPSEYKTELFFCLLTPQSNAKKCWAAIEKIRKLNKIEKDSILNILKTHTRFHNNKTRYLLEAESFWSEIENKILNLKTKELRLWLANNINGLGLKESAHFIRNIGKSNNQIAILDRHILKNLHNAGLIENPKIKNSKDYDRIESIFLNFASSINIPADELDLLFWSNENGEIFK